MNMLRFLAVLFCFASGPAAAQWQVNNHGVPIGRGAGVTGFGSATGANGQALFGVTGADPVFRAPSFTDLVGNISVNQMNSGTNANAGTFWNGAGAWSALPTSNVATISDLKAINTVTTTSTYLTDQNRAGPFQWRLGDYTAAIAADVNNGVFVKANAIPASTGAWVRQFDFTNFWSKWFGAVADYVTDNTAIINSMLIVGNIQNTNASPSKQTAIYINIEGGVKFSSQNVQWMPSVNWVYAYLRFWANSDNSKGVSTGGGFSNEYHELSVNSGQPGDATGALVAEWMHMAPLHPAVGVNVQKNVDNSIFAHSGLAQTVQPNANDPATASVAYIRDENLDRFRIDYSRLGSVSSFNGIFFTVTTKTTLIGCSGCNGAGAWGGNIPAVGAVVRDVSTNARYVVTSLATANALQTDWLSGAALPGDFLMNERAIFKGQIVGTTLTVTSMLQGVGNIAVGQTVVGMYANNGVTAATTITGLGTGTGGVGTYTVNNSQGVPLTEMVSGNVAANGIFGGGVVDTDTTYIPMAMSLKGDLIVKSFAFANVNACVANNKGAVTSITDSNTAVWGANIAGGRGNQVLAYCNGTNWTVSAK